MDIKIIFLLFLVATNVWALDSNITEMKSYNGKEKFNVTIIDGKSVSESCLKNKECLALKSLDKKNLKETPLKKKAGNPASDFCNSNSGHDVILKTKDLGEYDYCVMADNSMIDSWDLYYAHNPKNERPLK